MVTPPAAVLDTPPGVLRLQVCAYEFPDGRDRYDVDWLVIRVEWAGRLARCTLEGPYLEAADLTRWGNALVAYADASDRSELCLGATEPNLELRVVPSRRAGQLVLTVRLLGEPVRTGERFEVTAALPPVALVEFGRALLRAATAFPSRRVRRAD